MRRNSVVTSDEEFSNQDIAWGKDRARELFAQGVAPLAAASRAAAEMEDRARARRYRAELAQSAEGSSQHKQVLSTRLGELLMHKQQKSRRVSR